MGCESFEVLLQGGSLSADKICEYLLSLPNVRQDTWPRQQFADVHYFVRIGSDHAIEMEVSDYRKYGKGAALSCRIALCQPESAERAFAGFVKSLATSLCMTIRIMESFPVERKERTFDPTQFDAFEEVLHEGIKVERGYWVAEFGAEEAVLTCPEAIQKFVLPHCREMSEEGATWLRVTRKGKRPYLGTIGTRWNLIRRNAHGIGILPWKGKLMEAITGSVFMMVLLAPQFWLAGMHYAWLFCVPCLWILGAVRLGYRREMLWVRDSEWVEFTRGFYPFLRKTLVKRSGLSARLRWADKRENGRMAIWVHNTELRFCELQLIRAEKRRYAMPVFSALREMLDGRCIDETEDSSGHQSP